MATLPQDDLHFGGDAEQLDPVTGVDLSDIPTTGVEAMPVQLRDGGGVTHDGDMGRLGKN